MGNKNWSGYDDMDRKQDMMEKGMDMTMPRKRSRRDHGFYGHMKPSDHKKIKCHMEE